MRQVGSGASGSTARWQRARAAARSRDGSRCRRCGSTERLQVHHVVSLANGGAKYDPSNLITVCARCHQWVEGAPQRRRASLSHRQLTTWEKHHTTLESRSSEPQQRHRSHGRGLSESPMRALGIGQALEVSEERRDQSRPRAYDEAGDFRAWSCWPWRCVFSPCFWRSSLASKARRQEL